MKSIRPRQVKRYLFKLYVTGATARSTKAIANLNALCQQHLPGQYDLEVIDIYQQPDKARTEQIVAAPTLIKILPAPLRRCIGDLSDSGRLLASLQIIENEPLAPQREAPPHGSKKAANK
jgi:circadian clock protein KaiB